MCASPGRSASGKDSRRPSRTAVTPSSLPTVSTTMSSDSTHSCSSTRSAAWWATRRPRHTRRARDLATAARDPCLLREANVLVSGMLMDSGNIDEGRAVLEQEYREWQERDELFSAQVRWALAWLELWAGRWELAAEHAARARD